MDDRSPRPEDRPNGGPPERCDVGVVGAGAAGLMASIWAGRRAREAGTGPRVKIVAVDGARTLGAKILVAGGGRCNVTHFAVDETAYAGSTRPAIRKVLRSFDVGPTVEFFGELGVELKREETGKLFPVSDDARTVLNALLRAAREAGVEIRHPWRVGAVRREADGFVIERQGAAEGAAERLHAKRVIIATGGMALPKTGSDGHGYGIVRSLGHSVTARVFPALVPLTLDGSKSVLPGLSGLTTTATVSVVSGSGKKLVEFTNSLLCTHFGLSGPAILDVSRYWTDARRDDPGGGVRLVVNWIPGRTVEEVDAELTASGERRGKSAARVVQGLGVPERLARALCESCGIEPGTMLDQLKKEARRMLARATAAMEVPVTGDRGYTHAEVTAGGVPLSEISLGTMESRIVPGLHICGEICDVDGRIGGFNFQWAWASGYLAGRGAAAGVAEETEQSANRQV